MLSLTCCGWSWWKPKSRGNLHLVNHRTLETHLQHIWRDLHYLVLLPFPAVSKVLKPAEQLSLKLTPDYDCLISFSNCGMRATLVSLQTINLPRQALGLTFLSLPTDSTKLNAISSQIDI